MQPLLRISVQKIISPSKNRQFSENFIKQTSIFHRFRLKYECNLSVLYMWHFIGKGPIWSKWSYCQRRVVWDISKHLRPIPSLTVKHSQRNRHLNLKNERRENFKILKNRNFNFFLPEKSHLLITYVNQWPRYNLQPFSK